MSVRRTCTSGTANCSTRRAFTCGPTNSFNVVKAYSIYDDEVGYTQGLQFIVGPLLLNVGTFLFPPGAQGPLG